MPQTMTGGEAIIRAVLNHDVDIIYGLPGAQMYPLYDALHRLSNDVRTITTRHEQGAAYMAYGHAKSTGKPGVYTVVPGPGVLNTTAALATAWGADAPVLCLTGQIPSQYLGRRRGHLHEIPDQLETLRSLIKWAERIDTATDAPGLVNEAFVQMQSGRKGPVSLEMCWDTMGQSGDVEILQPTALPDPLEPDPDAIDAAVKLLKDARRVLICVGGGAMHASAEVTALAEALGAGVTSMRSGRGIVAEDHANGMSSAAGLETWPDTDVLIGIGSRLEMPYMRWAAGTGMVVEPDAPPHLIRIDIDADEMTRLVPHAGIVADAATGAAALTAAITMVRKPESDALDYISEAKARAAGKIQAIQPQMAYLEVIRDVLPRDGIFVEELCQVGFASYYGFPVYEPRTYITSGFQGTLGYGFPTALGVKAANPTKAVVSISGDGGFMYGMPELATAAQFNIGVVVILFNNGAFGNVRRDQINAYDGRTLGVDLVNPDFVALSESFGITAERVASPKALRPALETAIARDAPSLIEVTIDTDQESSPWPFIIPGSYV
jgi:acetolactate synthase I/II/III large subunit